MEKPYDLKALGQMISDKAKAAGIPHAAEEDLEKLAKATYEGMKDWLKESAGLTETKVDDVAVSFLSYLDPYVIPQIEKIDLDKDGK